MSDIDLDSVFIPITGFIAFAPVGTAMPTVAELADDAYVLPPAWKKGGLITTDGGFGWKDARGNQIEFFQDDVEISDGTGTATLTVKLAETNANVRTILRGVAPDASGGLDVDVDADVNWMILTEEISKNGAIRRRCAPNAWLTGNDEDRSTRGSVNAAEATFKVKRSAAVGGKHYREVVIAAPVV